jgi:hypothetical protein
LVAEGALSVEAIKTSQFASKGVTAAERKLAMSYDPGDRIRFHRDYTIDGARVSRDSYVTVRAVNQHAGTVTISTGSGANLDWRPAQKGAQRAEVYEQKPSELRVGDRIVWARNDADLGLRNGQSGVVERFDPRAKTVDVAFEKTGTVTLSMRQDSHRHWRHDYAQTAYAAQGKTSERVIVHAESNRINLVNQPSTYVAISRAKESGLLVTDDIGRLHSVIARRAGLKETALDATETQAAGAGVARGRAARATPMDVLREKAREIATSPRFSRNPEARAAVAEASRANAGMRPQIVSTRSGAGVEGSRTARDRAAEIEERATRAAPDKDTAREDSPQKTQVKEQEKTQAQTQTRDRGGFER